MAGTNWKSREDFKKDSALLEARKAGTLAPEQDEDGNDINPHIPQYIAQAPWYLNAQGPSLKHQKLTGQGKADMMDKWYQHGMKKGPAATKFRKGSCENCGAMTHKKADCVERPRKKGAKWTGKDIQADEMIDTELESSMDFDMKRDRWNGYDTRLHMELVKSHEKLDEERRKLRQEEQEKLAAQKAEERKKRAEEGVIDEDDEGESSDDDADGDLKDDKGEMVGQKVDTTRRTSVRNLRIREDTAKYLFNLDPKSAHYDPKSRSMRGAPLPKSDPKSDFYAGDNFVRVTGDTTDLAKVQLYAWEAYEKGQDISLNAAPSQAELLFKKFQDKKGNLAEKQKTALLSKYGGEEHLEAPPKELIFSQTEEYVEYGRDGRQLNGNEKAIPKSKYEEDVYLNNHTAVFGSYWESGQWGYKCCKQLIRNSYCTGEAGRIAAEERVALMNARAMEAQKPMTEAEKKAHEKKLKEERKKKEEEEEKKKKERFEAALKREEELARMDKEELDDRKRRYNSMNTVDVNEEEVEAYKLKRSKWEDPMKDYVDKE